MSDKPMLSKATKDALTKVRYMVPPMLEKFHKGRQKPWILQMKMAC